MDKSARQPDVERAEAFRDIQLDSGKRSAIQTWRREQHDPFLSVVVLMDLRLGADMPQRKRAVDRIHAAFPAGRLIARLLDE